MNQAKETNKSKKSTASVAELNFLDLAEKILTGLPDRSVEIVQRRFGLTAHPGETLEKIGKRYGITRERVRQIIAEAIKSVAKKSDHEHFLLAEERIVFTIEGNGGIIKKADAIEKIKVSSDEEANAIKFFAACSKKIFGVEEKGMLEKSWVVSKDVLAPIKKAIAHAEKNIFKNKALLSDEEIVEKLAEALPEFPKDDLISFLSVSEKVKKNKFGKWGMIDWMEISPKGTREKVHLILKEHKKPLHFTEIAELIDKYDLGKRKAHPQTVHNELIKDDRFVLVGRGIYALSEWGYFAGTIKDIIEVILKEAGRPMEKDEIVEKVLAMRKVKKTTIMINLNNRKFFQKKGNKYSLKK